MFNRTYEIRKVTERVFELSFQKKAKLYIIKSYYSTAII